MEFFSLEEAQLYRLLVSLFGRDRVVPQMSLLAVCGGVLPEELIDNSINIKAWAKSTKCLFTIIDAQSDPKMVVNFFSGFSNVIEPDEVQFQKYAPKLLEASGIRYVGISNEEFGQIVDPESDTDIVKFFQQKVL